MIFANLTALTGTGSIFSLMALLVALVLGALNVRNKYASGQDAQTIRSLKNSNDAYKTQAETDQLALNGKQRENELLVQKSQVLEDMRTQAPDIIKMAAQQSKQHQEVMSELGKVVKELSNVAKALVKDSHV